MKGFHMDLDAHYQEQLERYLTVYGDQKQIAFIDECITEQGHFFIHRPIKHYHLHPKSVIEHAEAMIDLEVKAHVQAIREIYGKEWVVSVELIHHPSVGIFPSRSDYKVSFRKRWRFFIWFATLIRSIRANHAKGVT